MSDYLAKKYDALSNECLELAAVYRENILTNKFDLGKAQTWFDLHKSCIHRAAAYARLANNVRITFDGGCDD